MAQIFQKPFGIVIPCYNEETRFKAEAFETFLAVRPSACLCFVDDGSQDRTLAVLQGMAQRFPKQVICLPLAENRGKAGAVREGMMALLERRPECKYLGYLDADLATPLEEFERLIWVVSSNKYDLAMGSRIAYLGQNIVRTRSRIVLSRFFAFMSGTILGLYPYDTQCGAKAFAQAFVPALFAAPFRNRWTFDVEILWRACKSGLAGRIREVPIDHWADVKGTKLTIEQAFEAGFSLVRLWLSTLAERRVVQLAVHRSLQEARKKIPLPSEKRDRAA